MRIAQVAPLIERVPPKTYGGTERVVSLLTEELVRRGHEVTLFASGDSITKARLSATYPVALREGKIKDLYGTNDLSLLNVALPYHRQDEFDIIHDHNAHLSAGVANIARTPTVLTMHGPFTTTNRRLFSALSNLNIVTVSKAAADLAYPVPVRHVIPHGIDARLFPFGSRHKGFLLYVGRFSPEKGVHLAIEVAQELHLPLVLAAKADPVDRSYFTQYIEPHLSPLIRWIGEVNEEERNALMSEAMCFLHPVIFQEPFGLTLIEAMACGCPVVAFRQGSIPEIVRDGKTGFVVRNLEGMIQAVQRISEIDREVCRQHVVKHFSLRRMVNKYEELYEALLSS